MSYLAQGPTISEAWVRAVEFLAGAGGKATNLLVASETPREHDGIRAELDAFKSSIQAAAKKSSRRLWPVDAVADTIFPNDLYSPGFGAEAATRLFENHRESRPLLRKLNPGDEYFDRLIDWPGKDGPINQLESLLERLNREKSLAGPKSSIYELAVAGPEGPEHGYDLRIHSPEKDRKKIMGFPCLSHISLTLHEGALQLVALYRNQYFISRAYGNLLGLSRLASFIGNEVGLEVGEIACLASHADLELGGRAGQSQRAVTDFLVRCEGSLDGKVAVS